MLYSILKTLCNTKEVLSLFCWVCWKSLNHWWITITSDYSKDNRVVNSYVLSGWGIYVLINIHLYRYSNIHGLTTFFLFCFHIFQVSDGPWFQYTENKHWYFYSANKLTWQEAKVSDMYIFFCYGFNLIRDMYGSTIISVTFYSWLNVNDSTAHVIFRI